MRNGTPNKRDVCQLCQKVLCRAVQRRQKGMRRRKLAVSVQFAAAPAMWTERIIPPGLPCAVSAIRTEAAP
jgi:hypothetical protein